MATIYNTPLSTASEKALFGRPGGGTSVVTAQSSRARTGISLFQGIVLHITGGHARKTKRRAKI